MNTVSKLSTVLFCVALMCSCASTPQSGALAVSADDLSGKADLAGISVFGQKVDFTTIGTSTANVVDEFGKGKTVTVTRESVNEPKIKQTVYITSYKDFPSMYTVKAEYENLSDAAVTVDGWTLCNLDVDKAEPSVEGDPAFWSFQGQSTDERNDWILPVSEGFFQQNFMGMNNDDYGGGIPVVCLWRRDGGVIIGHLAPNPELVSLPVSMAGSSVCANISLQKDFDDAKVLEPGAKLSTLTGFVGFYEGDCFSPLREYSQMLERVGVVMPESEPEAFETAWCAWGYGRRFTVEQIIGTLPKVAELGFRWATLDDGFQIAEGDWDVNSNKFPGGDEQMKHLVDMIHEYGMKAELWWCPMCADSATQFLQKYPNSVIIKKNGEPQIVSYWDSYYLSPVDEDVLREQAGWIKKFMNEWGFDGLKLDGQHMNAVEPDYNPAHHPDDPERSVRELPSFYKMIYDTARECKEDAVIQYCPCGDCFSVYNLQYTNKTVSSDPRGSAQMRSKGYVLRAIAPKTAYYGDHIELSDGGCDFPTQLGIGAVLGTKFTWPEDEVAAVLPQNPTWRRRSNFLTPEKEEALKNALSIYNGKMLSTGEYVPGLYDFGFDYPETHVIAKDGNLHYAFYTRRGDDSVIESVELRGLKAGHKYHVEDYYNHVDLGVITASDVTVLEHPFQNSLLLEVSEVK